MNLKQLKHPAPDRQRDGDQGNFQASIEEGHRLVRAFLLIENAALRKAIIDFTEALSNTGDIEADLGVFGS